MTCIVISKFKSLLNLDHNNRLPSRSLFLSYQKELTNLKAALEHFRRGWTRVDESLFKMKVVLDQMGSHRYQSKANMEGMTDK